ncbi:cadherin 23 [Tribolium castaneum]|uniref:Cadherin 23 n=1 Tax=Tribolium castaneum TaxID=7070 RepID=D6WC50_TRICA|nr:PREDICTED: cadherin-87A [Tribolium castaneum]XP_008190436.1 PREDICTED: cadherin-87A [Tribolium castaneum]EEZ99177.2 cadherin 23 [Tribolium castaneum]|eukprot:XP_008190435.1 PREDICTED: cadherin-87A [Tribolium castaneum]
MKSLPPTIAIFFGTFFVCYPGCSANLPPVFSMDINNLALSEKTPVGSVVYTLEGSDPENSTVHFNLEGTDVLKVNRNTGAVTVVKPLDYETNSTLNVIVSIEDEVEGGRNNMVSVPANIIILDENDNAPDFIDAPYDILAHEDTTVGTTIFSKIFVEDKDTTGANLEVECINLPEYQNACDFFQVETLQSAQNSYHGAIVLRRKVNYTQQDKHQFLLKATDGELSSSTSVTVNIGDVQDTPPRFIGNLVAEVSENATINSLVMTIHAEDGDRGVPRKIVYELINNPMDYFILDAVTGELRTARPLDKEAVNNPDGILTLNVKAHELVDGIKGTDPSTVTNAEVLIKIKDVNDEPPAFNKREYFVQIPENISEGSPLPGLEMVVTDPDEGNNSVFSLQLNDISSAFSIEPKTVIGSSAVTIRVANSSLDYEDLNQRKFIILALAKELYTEEKLSSTATVTVSVSDINDNAPTFDQDGYSTAISEVSSPGTPIITITARDRDSGKFGEDGIFYHISGSGSERFVVHNRTGTVAVAECEHPGKKPCLDFEDKAEYHLQFIATDDDGKGQTTKVPLKILLTDNNDNAPVFTQSIYRAFINEAAVRFDPDLIIEAVDADKTSHVTYSIISGNDEGLFSIEPNLGKIRISNSKGVDVSNDTENVILLTVMASDGTFTTTSLVNITIRDVNNNHPIFTKENYVVAIAEDVTIGSSIIQLQANDMDTGSNAEIEYSIQKGAYDDFQIDNTTGVVVVASKLDFDRRNTYNIEIIARDHGEPPLTGTTTLTANIINTNDKMPYFVPTTQKAEIMEDAPIGSVVHTLIALDPDVNSTEALNFAATEPITALDKHGNEVFNDDVYRGFFSVDKTTGKVTVLNKLQRDVAAIVRITVLVTDITAPTVQQGEGLLIITITDVNDSPPVFLPPWTPETPLYTLELKEEQPVGTIVATYKAIDDGSDIAGYAILPENEYFEINNGTGIVQIRKQIDYEKTPQLNFTILAFDSGIPQLNTSASVFVKVINLNDNDPIFSEKNYKASIYENSPNGTFVVKVKATDADSGDYGKLNYELTGEHSENFEITPDTGVITVANSNFLDHEKINETVIQVVASDGAPHGFKRSVTVPVNINILDVNDNAPKFNQSEYNVTVIENVRLNPPQPLLQVNATDEDSGINGNIHYDIIGGNDNDVFLLGVETGILYPHKSLLGQKRNFHLVIEARDGGGNGQLFDRAVINVQVLNVNEHRPDFIIPFLPNATVEITENAAVENYLVMTVKATDKDENENGRITYHLKVDGENVQETNEFSIDANTGELRSKKFLDREETSKYELVLVARDHGSPKWFETLRYLTILLVDTNDNRPEFPDSHSANPYHFYVTENDKSGVRIGQVKALDRDEGNHAKVYYYFLRGNENGDFRLDKTEGYLYANKSFDRERQDEYNLYIIATNDADYYISPQDRETLAEADIIHDSSIAKITVTITDLNDNVPVFEQAIYYSAVNAMAEINDFVTNVTAVDPDLGPNGSLTYYIKAANLYKYGSNKSSGSIIPSPFNITDKGEMCTANYLAENNQHRFVVDIIARENAFPEREAYTQVHVWIFEPEQLIRVILSRPSDEVVRERDEIVAELSNATQSLVIIDEIRYHTDDNGYKNEEWSDMYILVVDPLTQNILPVPEVLKIIDSKYDFLKDYYAGFAIENVVPAFVMEKDESFDPALAALIALLIVLFVGVITFIIVCCCLRHWVISPTDLKKKDALIKKAIIDDLNTTENPLWIEQKLKIYEEQELTMQVFNEPEQNVLGRRNSDDFIPDDNTYATIQHPNRRGSAHIASRSLADDLADYATLSGVPHQTDSSHSSLRGAPNFYEAAMGFQGSTFQVPERMSNDDYGSYRTRFKGSELTINQAGQPEYVAELI